MVENVEPDDCDSFHYGSPSDFDEWAMIADSEEWGWLEFQDYFMKFEGFTQNRSYRSKQAARGIAGPVQTGFAGHYSEFAKLFTKACARAGIPRKHDFNTSEGTLGTGKTMTFIDGAGKRSSTETAYLTHEVLARPNLSVLTGAHVTRILLQRSVMDGHKRVSGVEFAHGPERRRYRVRALREVVLSAGAVHTPHVLMLSGIGPEEHLREVGVPVLHNLPGVGQHLLDHPSVNLRFRTTSDSSLNKMTGATGWKQIYALPSLAEWALFGTGKMLCTIAESVSFVRSTDPRLFPKHIYPDQVEDATSGTHAPDLELYASPLAWWNHGRPTTQLTPESKEGLCSMSAILLRPTSTGEILLRSADPFDAPLVNPNYLATKHDVDVMRRGLRFLLRLGLTQPLAGVIVRTEPCPSLDQALHGCTDAELDAVIRQRIETLYHPTSSCRMAGLNQNGVVDARLQVHGVEGLRVCDASAFPTITSGHTAAPVMAMAEKCADMMRKALYQTNSRQRS